MNYFCSPKWAKSIGFFKKTDPDAGSEKKDTSYKAVSEFFTLQKCFCRIYMEAVVAIGVHSLSSC